MQAGPCLRLGIILIFANPKRRGEGGKNLSSLLLICVSLRLEVGGLSPCWLLSGPQVSPGTRPPQISPPQKAGGPGQGTRSRRTAAPHELWRFLRVGLSLRVGLRGLRYRSWTVILTSNALPSFPWNLSRLQVPAPRSLPPSLSAPGARPAGIGPAPCLFPGLFGLDSAPFPAPRLGATCRPGGAGTGTRSVGASRRHAHLCHGGRALGGCKEPATAATLGRPHSPPADHAAAVLPRSAAPPAAKLSLLIKNQRTRPPGELRA